MAFATSSAAFGIKSTAPANNSLFGQKPAGGLFGAQPQTGGGAFGQPAGGGLFGQPQQNQQQQPAAGTNIFGQPQQPAGGGLFGQSQNQQQPAAGGLFGQQQQQQQPATGGLFGQPQNQQQPAAGGGLFGQSQTQPATGGLFGQPQQQQQPAAGGGLFGQSTQQPAAGGGLFGQSQTQQPAAGGGGLFGQSQNQQGGGLRAGGLFGASQQQPAAGTGGGGLFGSSSLFGAPKPPAQSGGLFGATSTNQPQQQSLFGGNSTNTNPLFGSNNNTANSIVKKTLEEIDAHIQGRIQISKDLHQRKLGDEATKGQETIRAVHKDLINTTTAIRNDLHFTRDLKGKTDQAVQDTIVATRLVDGFRNPHANAAYLKDHAGFPLEFFTRVTVQMRERLAWYKTTIEQIERKLSSSANQTQSSQYTPQGIHATLQAQHATFLALAAKTAAVDAQLAKIKQIYTQLWRAKTGSRRDPFEERARAGEEGEDLGLGGLSV
ncbi:hypothetical protein MVEN_02120100 [Mycena venus]|uniref:Nucleoporin nup45 n=1 Tax=Mycena venus TaxID=2733690 RepID=A0A8H6X906_9AGAR|nr:hypothetical protein MVEN_02120100 [Mycena venus]